MIHLVNATKKSRLVSATSATRSAALRLHHAAAAVVAFPRRVLRQRGQLRHVGAPSTATARALLEQGGAAAQEQHRSAQVVVRALKHSGTEPGVDRLLSSGWVGW